MIVAEAAAKLIEPYPDVIAGHPGIPWRSMRARRAHDYFSIDLDIVWDTVLNALADLRGAHDRLG